MKLLLKKSFVGHQALILIQNAKPLPVDFIGSPLSSFRDVGRPTMRIRLNSSRKNQASAFMHHVETEH
ncbi:MAG: hypothetical protein JXQ27_15050 [Acidobacteria bacterium]|nr:hypothetical protein [Acidobacteriota bacterium]